MAKRQAMAIRGQQWWWVIGALVLGATAAFWYAKGLVSTST
jgi:uncharacterized protein involved in exopolysaccharide biosynthesis